MKKYGLVLSGGGTKGAFEIGVWKALLELDIPISCVVGTSIGAINAACIAQGNFKTIYDFWNNLDVNDVLNLNTLMTTKYISDWSPSDFESFRLGFLQDIFGGGLDISPLRKNLNALLDENKIRSSGIRLGLITVDLTNLSPVQLMIEDISQGKLLDFLLASAALPIFKRQEIDGKTYIDGGFYDNVPINFLIDNGYQDIISVEFPALGIKQKTKDKNINLIVVNNSEYLGMTLEFDKETINNNLNMGYLDCLKTFGALKGKSYYIDLNGKSRIFTKLSARIGTLCSDTTFNQKITRLLDLEPNVTESEVLEGIVQLVNATHYPKGDSLSLSLLEITAKCVGVKRLERYSPDALILAILNTLNDLTKANLALIRSDKTIEEAFNDGPTDFKPSTLFDFTAFYVLYISTKNDIASNTVTSLVKKFTPEFSVGILLLIYLHQLIREM